MANNQQLLMGEGAGGAPVVYIEDVYSTYLYTGNGSTQTITNNIDLSTKGGLVWYKARALGYEHELVDTARGAGFNLETPNTTASTSRSTALTAFNTTGFTLGNNVAANGSGDTFVSWTFREQPKFFDIVTYTGTGSNTTIAHALGAVPGCIIVKRTDTTADWAVYHRSLANTQYLVLNTTVAAATGATWWNSTTPTSSVFSVGTDASVNASGGTYVAYLFAHDAGGFGLAGTDNVISCGSFTTVGSGKMSAPVNLGYEAQWLLAKNINSAENWVLYDIMRGMNNTGYAALNPNTSGAEYTGTSAISPTATGFDTPNANGPFANSTTYIYIAIRRGPMKVPTVGTSVFSPQIWTGTGTTQQITTGFFPDMFIGINRGAVHASTYVADILRGLDVTLATNLTNAENSASGNTFNMTGYSNNNGNLNSTFGGGQTYVGEFFRRAPSFFDEVCYTGTGVSNQAFTHNLGAAPELMIIKMRVFSSGTGYWFVYSSTLGYPNYLLLNATDASAAAGIFGSQNPDSSSFYVSAGANINSTASQYVAYLFATCAGVSKVGSYTGNGSSQTLACGFTAGSRFVLIKRTDSTGDWYVWDSARGIVAGNDPHLSLNTTAAEVTSDDSVDTDNSGFIVNQLSATNVNVTSATYIFLAIA